MVCKFDFVRLWRDGGSLAWERQSVPNQWGPPNAIWKPEVFAAMRIASVADQLTARGMLKDKRELVEKAASGVKRKAGALGNLEELKGLSHAQRLDVAAQMCGFESWFDVSNRSKLFLADSSEPLLHSHVIPLAVCAWGAPEDWVEFTAVRHAQEKVAEWLDVTHQVDRGAAREAFLNMFVVTNDSLQRGVEHRGRAARKRFQDVNGAALEREMREAYDSGDYKGLLKIVNGYVSEAERLDNSRDVSRSGPNELACKEAMTSIYSGWLGDHRWRGVGRFLDDRLVLDGGMDALKGLTREVCLRDMMACPACQETVAAAMELGLEVFAEGSSARVGALREAVRIADEAGAPGWFKNVVDIELVDAMLKNGEAKEGQCLEVAELLGRVTRRVQSGQTLNSAGPGMRSLGRAAKTVLGKERDQWLGVVDEFGDDLWWNEGMSQMDCDLSEVLDWVLKNVETVEDRKKAVSLILGARIIVMGFSDDDSEHGGRASVILESETSDGDKVRRLCNPSWSSYKMTKNGKIGVDVASRYAYSGLIDWMLGMPVAQAIKLLDFVEEFHSQPDQDRRGKTNPAAALAAFFEGQTHADDAGVLIGEYLFPAAADVSVLTTALSTIMVGVKASGDTVDMIGLSALFCDTDRLVQLEAKLRYVPLEESRVAIGAAERFSEWMDGFRGRGEETRSLDSARYAAMFGPFMERLSKMYLPRPSVERTIDQIIDDHKAAVENRSD